jgi:lipopolysaccharide heptosyltransferase I
MPSNPPIPDSILIVRLGAMGDVLHAMPAVAALRQALPDAHIGWAIERRWAELLRSENGARATTGGRDLVDCVHLVDTHNWRKNFLAASTMRDIRSAVGSMRAEKYAVAIDIQGASKSVLLAKLSRAASIYGFQNPRENLATIFYSTKVNTSVAHIVDQNLELCSAVVRTPLTATEFDLPRSVQADEWVEGALKSNEKFAIINPGSGWGAKCWPAERFAEVARRLRASGIASIINYGPGEEELANLVAKLSEGAGRPISCTISQLIELTRRAALFIGGDTGPLHLAAAVKIPVVALFGPTDPARNGPFGTPSSILRSSASVTSYSHVAEPDPGLQSIKVDEVVRAVSQLPGVTIG